MSYTSGCWCFLSRNCWFDMCESFSGCCVLVPVSHRDFGIDLCHLPVFGRFSVYRRSGLCLCCSFCVVTVDSHFGYFGHCSKSSLVSPGICCSFLDIRFRYSVLGLV